MDHLGQSFIIEEIDKYNILESTGAKNNLNVNASFSNVNSTSTSQSQLSLSSTVATSSIAVISTPDQKYDIWKCFDVINIFDAEGKKLIVKLYVKFVPNS